MLEHQFDGLCGPTHHYAGLSPGNLASQQHAGQTSNPRGAALEGLAKMRQVRALGVPQHALPPQPRPHFAALRALGFEGSEPAMARAALERGPDLLHAVSSASSMWAANAATVLPSADSVDGRVHFVPANLVSLLHRSLEAPFTRAVLKRVFSDAARFAVHDALPATEALSDEGAANHCRLATSSSLHLFGWGKRPGAAPTQRYPARQALAASEAVARLAGLAPERAIFWQQSPRGIDAGAFHSDVLAVSNGCVLLLHEHAFVETHALVELLKERLGEELRVVVASDAELPLADAVAAYPFNSQLLTTPSGKMQVLAPSEARDNAAARRFLERAVDEVPELEGVAYVAVNGSMRNGGGPACLRLRVPLTDAEAGALTPGLLLDDALDAALTAIIERRYRDRLSLADLADPELLRESSTALDEITAALGLGSVYDFQRS